jgi:hypothetical protein
MTLTGSISHLINSSTLILVTMATLLPLQKVDVPSIDCTLLMIFLKVLNGWILLTHTKRMNTITSLMGLISNLLLFVKLV